MLHKKLVRTSLAILLSGCFSIAQAEEKNVIVTVNGKAVTQTQLYAYIKNTAPKSDIKDPKVNQQLLQAYIGRELLYQEAITKKIDQPDAVQAILTEQQHAFITQLYVSQILKANPVTKEQVKAAYDKEVKKLGKAEYRTSQILTETEADAKKVIERLNKGEDFAKVAAEASKDPSGKRGGDIGWMPLTKMPNKYGEAIGKTPVGKYTQTAVKTDFGWHVIKVDSSRPIQPPPFDKVGPQIARSLQDNIVSQHIGELQKKAKIESGK